MSLRPLPALLHVAAISVMSYGYSQLHTGPMNNFILTQRGGHFQFLTIQGLAAAWVTMILSLGGDLFPKFRDLSRLKRSILLISLPLACTISTIYWSLIAFAPALILPRLPPSPSASIGEPSSAADGALARIPVSLDLALHASPAIFLALDFFLLERKFNSREAFRKAPAAAILAGIWYGGFVEYLAPLNNGKFPYPFLTFNPLPVRMAIYTGATLLAFLSLNLLNSVHPGRPLTADIDVVQEEISPRRPGSISKED